jgi:hypothetical protein
MVRFNVAMRILDDSGPRVYNNPMSNHSAVLRLRAIYFSLALIFLSAGGFIYFSFRSTDLIMFGWIDSLGLSGMFARMRGYFRPLGGSLSPILIYNLPDGLWFLAGTLFIRSIWLADKKWRRVYLYLFYFAAVLEEILQALAVIPGTFDFLDLLAFAAAAVFDGIISLYVNRLYAAHKKAENHSIAFRRSGV